MIFDSFVDESPKAYERLRRSSKAEIELSTIGDDVPLLKQMDKFWPSSTNKAKLQSYIKESVLRNRSRTQNCFVVLQLGIRKAHAFLPIIVAKKPSTKSYHLTHLKRLIIE